MQHATILERHLRLPGTRNLRDVGGYPAGDDRQTRWRTLLRTDALDRLPVTSQATLVELGLRQAIDLRWHHEIEEAPSVFVRSDRVRYTSVPLRDIGHILPASIPQVYRHILDTRGSQLLAVARALLEPGGLPAIVGCAAGVDRTGVTIALLLTAVGVAPDVVATDYACSADHFAGDGVGSDLDDWRAGPVRIDCLPEYMLDSLDHLDRQHGGSAAFMLRNGLTQSELDRLADLLTQPTG
jgi:protein-tyrosine phosphatase